MARYQGSFSAMLSGLRGYVTTRNRTFRGEYDANLALNQIAWDRLTSKRGDADAATAGAAGQHRGQPRATFCSFPSRCSRSSKATAGREDLYLLQERGAAARSEYAADPRRSDQQPAEPDDRGPGPGQGKPVPGQRTNARGRRWSPCCRASLLAIIFQSNITGPIRRLTDVVQQIRGGDLDARTPRRVERRNRHPGDRVQWDDGPAAGDAAADAARRRSAPTTCCTS